MSNVLSRGLRLSVLAGLVDGNSVRAVTRMTGVHQDTISRLALRVGAGCDRLHNRIVRNLTCTDIQIDEQWGFVAKKQHRITPADPAEFGEAYCFVGMSKRSRLVIEYRVGKRSQETTDAFIAGLRARLLVVPQITSDGYQPYIPAIAASFGPGGVHYGQTVKNYVRGGLRDDHRYEPPRGGFITKKVVFGTPDMDTASTAYLERNNLTTRHTAGRLRRLCLAFSKRMANHKAAVALNYVHGNLCRVVSTLRVTPAMEEGLTDHVWDLAELMDAAMSELPGEAPEPQPLRHATPKGPARALPEGRGWLRIVPRAG